MKGVGKEVLKEILTTEKLRLNNPYYAHPAAAELAGGLDQNGVKGLWQAQADYFARTGSTDVGLAESFALAGDNEKAYHWLERAYQDHELAFSYAVVDPIFVSLRSDERFDRLVHYKSG